MRRDDGFTLIELLVGLGIAAVLMTLSGMALRSYWFAQSLNGATDEIITQLRELQEDAVSQSFPIVFGARFEPDPSSSWDLVRYNPNAVPTSNKCTVEDVTIDSGVFNAGVRIASTDVTNDPLTETEYSTCVTEGDIGPSDDVIWFYARGTSNGGTIIIEHPISGKQETVTVGKATGRVEELDG